MSRVKEKTQRPTPEKEMQNRKQMIENRLRDDGYNDFKVTVRKKRGRIQTTYYIKVEIDKDQITGISGTWGFSERVNQYSGKVTNMDSTIKGKKLIVELQYYFLTS